MHDDFTDMELIDHLIDYQAPRSDEVIADIQEIRAKCKALAKWLVAVAPKTPDRRVAIRKIHDACQASIAALVLNQEVEA